MVQSSLRPTPETTGACVMADVEARDRADPEGEAYRLVKGALRALRGLGMTDAEIEREFGITLKPEHRAPILPA